jgi:hypothetical protein
MTRIVLAIALGLGLSIVGCSADGSSGSKNDSLPTTTDDAKTPTKASSSSGGDSADDGHYTPEPSGSPEPADPATPSTPSSPSNPATPPTTPDPGTPKATPGTPQTKTCTSTDGSNNSVTTVTFAVDSAGGLTVSKMTVAMTNKDNRDKNDVDVYITPQGGSEKKSFNSGDTLPNGKTTQVFLPSSFNVTMGAKIRISTNFDQPLIDPSASCTIQF